jgi:hypothetical protein
MPVYQTSYELTDGLLRGSIGQKLNFAANSIVRFSVTTEEITPTEAGLLIAELGTLKLG